MTQENKTCDQCGTAYVLSPKTGKWFCPNKCWLKGQPSKPQYQRPQQNNMLLDELTGLQAKVKELEGRLDSAGEFIVKIIRLNNLKQ